MATTQNSIVLKKMNSANVRLDNSGDTDRVYEIASNTDVTSGVINSFNGEVCKDGSQVANFNSYGPNENLTVNFQVTPVDEQCAVLTAVQEFIAASRAYVSNAPALADMQ